MGKNKSCIGKDLYSKKFLEEHEDDIIIHRAAKKAFDELGVKKLPTVKSLQVEFAEKLAEKKEAYSNATELSEGMLNACVELIKVHADGSLEITFNYMQEFKELLETTERLKKEVA